MTFLKKFHFSLLFRASVIKFFLIIFSWYHLVFIFFRFLILLIIKDFFIIAFYFLLKPLSGLIEVFKYFSIVLNYIFYKLNLLRLYFYILFVRMLYLFIILIEAALSLFLKFFCYLNIDSSIMILSILHINFRYRLNYLRLFVNYSDLCVQACIFSFYYKLFRLISLNYSNVTWLNVFLFFNFVYFFIWAFRFFFFLILVVFRFVVLFFYSIYYYLFVLDLGLFESNIFLRFYLFFHEFYIWFYKFFINFLYFYDLNILFAFIFFFLHLFISFRNFISLTYSYLLRGFYNFCIWFILFPIFNFLVIYFDRRWFMLDSIKKQFILNYILLPMESYFNEHALPILSNSSINIFSRLFYFALDLLFTILKFSLTFLASKLLYLFLKLSKFIFIFSRKLFSDIYKLFFYFYNNILMPIWFFFRMPLHKWRSFLVDTLSPRFLNFIFKRLIIFICIIANSFFLILSLLKFFYAWIFYVLNFLCFLVYLLILPLCVNLLNLVCLFINLFKSKKLFFIFARLLYLDLLETYYNIQIFIKRFFR